MELFTGQGYAGTPMRAIASEVGIKAASIYAHFPEGKEELLKAALREIFDEFLAFVVAPLKPAMTPAEQLQIVVTRHATWQLTMGKKAPAWDAAVRQFGVAGVLNDRDVTAIRQRQSLYHDYVKSLVRTRTTSKADEKTGAILALCDQVNLLMPRRQGRGHADQAVEDVWRFSQALLAA